MALGIPNFGFTYGSRTIDQGELGRPVGRYRLRRGLDGGEFEVLILVLASSTSNLDTYCDLIAADLRKQHQKLTLVVNSASREIYDPADRTGWRPVAELEKIGEDVDGPRSRLFKFSLAWGSPDEDVTHPRIGSVVKGLREWETTLEYSPSRRRSITLAGTFTGHPGAPAQSAQQAYDTGIGDVVEEELFDIFGLSSPVADEDLPYRLTLETTRYDDTQDVLTFTRIYDQVLEDQVQFPVLKHPLLRDQQLTVHRIDGNRVGGTVGGGLADGFANMVCNYTAALVEDESDAENIRAFYDANIQAHLENAIILESGGPIFIETEDVAIDAAESRITVSMSALAPPGDIVEANLVVSVITNSGTLPIPRASGKDHEYTLLQGAKRITRIVNGTFLFAIDPADVHPFWASGGDVQTSEFALAWSQVPYGDPTLAARLTKKVERITSPTWLETVGAPSQVSVTPFSPDGEAVWVYVQSVTQQLLVLRGVPPADRIRKPGESVARER